MIINVSQNLWYHIWVDEHPFTSYFDVHKRATFGFDPVRHIRTIQCGKLPDLPDLPGFNPSHFRNLALLCIISIYTILYYTIYILYYTYCSFLRVDHVDQIAKGSDELCISESEVFAQGQLREMEATMRQEVEKAVAAICGSWQWGLSVMIRQQT